MNETLKLLGLLGLLLTLLGLTALLFGSATETSLREVFEEPSSAALMVFIVFAALAMDVILPLPASLLSVAAMAGLGPGLGIMIVWLGMTTGHVIGFMFGAQYGVHAVNQIAGLETGARLQKLGNTVGMSAVLAITRAVPLLSEACAIVAGASGMTLGKFLFVTATANFGIAMVYGLLIGNAGNAVSLPIVFIASIAVPTASYGILRWITTSLK